MITPAEVIFEHKNPHIFSNVHFYSIEYLELIGSIVDAIGPIYVYMYVYIYYTVSFKIKYKVLNQYNFHCIIDTILKQNPLECRGIQIYFSCIHDIDRLQI